MTQPMKLHKLDTLECLGIFEEPPKIAKESDIYFNLFEKRIYQYSKGKWEILKPCSE